jgi:hypothetical protein
VADNHREVRNLRQIIFRGLVTLQQRVGDTVTWYEADEEASTTDTTYTEGPVPGISFPDTYGETITAEASNAGVIQGGNLFKAPITLPAVWVRYMDPFGTQTEDGSYLTSHLSMRVSSDQMRKQGLGNPEDPFSHMNDRFAYKSNLYRVQSYAPRGWLTGMWFMVDIVGVQLKPADLYTDPFPFWQPPTPPWGPAERVNWPVVPPTSWTDSPYS